MTVIAQDTPPLVKTHLCSVFVVVLSLITSWWVAAAAAGCTRSDVLPHIWSCLITFQSGDAIACIFCRVTLACIFLSGNATACKNFWWLTPLLVNRVTPFLVNLVCRVTPWLVILVCSVFHPKCLWHIFFGHARHAHTVRRWCWSAAVCSTGGGCQTQVAPCRDGTSSAPMTTCPCTSCWQAFQTQRLERDARSAQRRHGPRCRRAGAESTSVSAT